MILALITASVIAILQSILIFLVGKILSRPTELRKFLKLNTADENVADFQSVMVWVRYIGQMLKIYAIISVIMTLLSSPLITFFYNQPKVIY